MKYLSLFSGIGGFELGLENSKYEFENVGYSEIDSYAKSIYTRHFPRHKDLGDATEIDTKQLQDFDLLVAGFPCQAFSLSGYRRGFADARGTLFFEIARILKDKKPKYFLLENVKGLISHQRGETFKTMLGILSELGYDVEWEVLNSKSFRTAQNRERLYIKGYFRAKCGGEILSASRIGKETSLQRLKPYKFDRQVKKRVHECDYDELSAFLREYKSKSGLSNNAIAAQVDKPVSEVEHWFRTDKFFAPPTEDVWLHLKEILGIDSDKYDDFMLEFEWVDGVYDMDKRAYDIDGLSPTLCSTETLTIQRVGNLSRTGHAGDDILGVDGLSTSLTASNHKHPLRIKTDSQTDALSTKTDWRTVDADFRIRKLTPTECERLQAFPDGWTKYGKDGELISDTQRYKCLGNAVTTTVVTWIADTMFGGIIEGK